MMYAENRVKELIVIHGVVFCYSYCGDLAVKTLLKVQQFLVSLRLLFVLCFACGIFFLKLSFLT